MKAAGLAAAAVGCLGIAAASYFAAKKPHTAPPLDLKVPLTADRIARGRYIYMLADCDDCHSPRDFSRFNGPVIESRRGEGVEFPAEMGLPGRIAARNITPDVETGIGSWTDGEKIRAIRDGVSRDGTALFPMMPYESFRHMSDEDVVSLVAYLNTLPPVKHRLERSQIDFPVCLLMKDAPRPAGSVAPPDRSNRARYGEYLTELGGCRSCHSPHQNGAPAAGREFSGGERFPFPGALVVSANITPDQQTGIGRWTEADFVGKFHQYREYAEKGPPSAGPENFTLMPWLTFSHIQTEDLQAIYAFLRTRKPVYQIVDSHPGINRLASGN